MYGINLQLFNSKVRISIFVNLPKKFCVVLRKLRKTKISFHVQLSQKIFPVLRKYPNWANLCGPSLNCTAITTAADLCIKNFVKCLYLRVI